MHRLAFTLLRREVGELAEAAVGRCAAIERFAFALEARLRPALRRATDRLRERLRVADDVVHVLAARARARRSFAQARFAAARRRLAGEALALRSALSRDARRERRLRALERDALVAVRSRAPIEARHDDVARRVTTAVVDLSAALRGDARSALRVLALEPANGAVLFGRDDEDAADEGGDEDEAERAHQNLAVVVGTKRVSFGRRKAVMTAAAPSVRAAVEIHANVVARSAAAPASSTRQKSRAAMQLSSR